MNIVKANLRDIDAIKSLADKHRNELGFVLRSSLEDAAERGWLLVALYENEVVGFCVFRHCTRVPGRTTIYEILSERKGAGRSLIDTLIQNMKDNQQRYIYLKCPEDLPSNHFYQHMGFQKIIVEDGKKRRLNVWRLDVC